MNRILGPMRRLDDRPPRKEHWMMGNARIVGSLHSHGGAGVIRIEDRYDTDIDDLWAALTDPDRLIRWWGAVNGDLRPGGEFSLHIDSAGMDATGRVETCEPPRHLRFTIRETEDSWRQGQGANPFDESIEATLTADDDHHTTLLLEVRGMPLDRIAFYGVGWQLHAENLAAHVTGRQSTDTEARWDDLLPPYQDQASHIT